MHPTEMQALVDAVVERLSPRTQTIRVVQDEVPLGIDVQANSPAGYPTTIIVTPERGELEIVGVRSLNEPGQINIHTIHNSESELALNAGVFDSASYSVDPTRVGEVDGQAAIQGYYRVVWGTISQQRPMTIVYSSIGLPALAPYLRWTLFGRYAREIAVRTPLAAPSVDQVLAALLPPAASEAARAPSGGAAAPQPWGIPRRTRLQTLVRRR